MAFSLDFEAKSGGAQGLLLQCSGDDMDAGD